ncbi:hypothetical protein JCM21900_001186 [Sporobolomyces salmonicolor]
MVKAPRSQFLQKLHHVLENPLDPAGLRWVSDDSFEISSKDAVAIRALSPAFEFRSLSSFIRQLSYYAFRRLSDRRRSTERRSSNVEYIVFTHPSGFFVRGDSSKLTKIIRRARGRPAEQVRRTSLCSIGGSDDGLSIPGPHPPPSALFTTLSQPTWAPHDLHPQSEDERRALASPAQFPTSLATLYPPAYPAQTDHYPQRRDYISAATSTWIEPTRETDKGAAPYRRASLVDLGLSSFSSTQTTYMSSLPSVAERPPPRRASIGVEMTSSLIPQVQRQSPPEAVNGGVRRSSPYLPPTFSPPTTNTFFTSTPFPHPHPFQQPQGQRHELCPPPPPPQQRTYPTYSESPHFFPSTYEPVAPPPAPHQPHTSLPSPAASGACTPDHSPHTMSVPVPLPRPVPMLEQSPHLDPRHLVGGGALRPHHLDEYSYSSRQNLVGGADNEAAGAEPRSYGVHPYSPQYARFKPSIALPPVPSITASSSPSTFINSWSSPAPLRCTAAGY